MAYGIARQMILRDGVDLKFTDEWTVGYDEFKKEALSWTPDQVERVTGVAREQIEEIAALYIEETSGRVHDRPGSAEIR